MTGITDRIDNTTRIPPAYLKAAPPAPKSVKIEISPRCNYRCGFCALRTREVQPKWDMDFGLFKRVTREMREAGVEEIGVFYLGESFMNPRLLVDCIAYLKRELGNALCLPHLQRLDGLSRGGRGMHEGRARLAEMVGQRGRRGAVREDHGRVGPAVPARARQHQGGLGGAPSAAATRPASTPRPSATTASSRQKMEALLAERVRPYVDQHYWLPLYSMGAFATQREEELGYRPTAGNQGRIGALREPLPCWSAFTEGHVTAEGKLSACCFDATANWTMGDLNRQSFMEAWNSRAVRQAARGASAEGRHAARSARTASPTSERGGSRPARD